MTHNLRRTTLRTLLALLTALILLNSACTIGNYSPAELSRKGLVESHDQRDQREFLSFSYIPESRDKLESNPRTLPSQSQLVKDHLEQHSRFMKVIVTSSPPIIGTHVMSIKRLVLIRHRGAQHLGGPWVSFHATSRALPTKLTSMCLWTILWNRVINIPSAERLSFGSGYCLFFG